MFKRSLLALAVFAAISSAHAANSPDDIFLDKIKFIQYHSATRTDYTTATQQFIQSVNQSDGATMSALGRAFMRLKDFDNAKSVLLAAVRVAPSNADAQADLAYVSAMSGPDCFQSRAAYERAVALNPALSSLWTLQQARVACQTLLR